MKKLIALALLATPLLGCQGPLGKLGRVWPDGASVTLRGVHASASMTGGNFDAAEISWIGVKGFPLPGSGTNTTTTTTTLSR